MNILCDQCCDPSWMDPVDQRTTMPSLRSLGWLIAFLALLDAALKVALTARRGGDGRGHGGAWVPEWAREGSSRRSSTGATEAGGAEDRCLLSLIDCDLSCLDWTIVLSAGRAGSTTVLRMLADLPGMHFYGEEGGLLDRAREFQERVDKSRRMHRGQLAWLGAEDSDVRTVACMTQ